jgi:molybdenum cofactor cytidylyltransferase
MGKPKALLEWRGLPFIEHVCAALRKAGVEDRVVVLGRDSQDILARWRPAGEKVAVNLKPEHGQLSSLKAGLLDASPTAEGFIICLADQPTVPADTYKKLIAFWSERKESIAIPKTFRASDSRFKRGHPIILPASARALCFEAPLDKGLHWVTHHSSMQVTDLEVKDQEIIRDFDTPEDYEALVKAG